jgi:hypothetical protein
MDPYLEEPSEWSEVHHELISMIRYHLAAALQPNFVVSIEHRVYLSFDSDETNGSLQSWQTVMKQFVPDVHISQPRPFLTTPEFAGFRAAVATALPITPPLLLEPIGDFTVREAYLEIRDKKNRQVITIIELISPFNKVDTAEGYKVFHQKRDTMLQSNVNWVEIDLVRAGKRPPQLANKSDYYALLKRKNRPGPYEVWFFNLRDTMPNMTIPLQPPFDDVPLNLQAVFDEVYQRSFYANSVNYEARVTWPMLLPADEIWAKKRIMAWQADEPPESER